MSQLSVTAALQYGLVSPKGTQEGEEYMPSKIIRLQSLPTMSPKGAQEVKHRILAQ